MADFTLMTFEEDGFPVEVHGREDCERAVAEGRVTAQTEITVYDTDRRVRRERAGDAPIFAALFKPEPVASPPPAPPVDEAPMPILPIGPTPPPPPPAFRVAPAVGDRPDEPRRAAPPVAQGGESGGGVIRFLLIGLAMALIAAIAWIVVGPGSHSSDGNVTADAMAGNSETAAQDLPATDDTAAREIRYAVREVELMREARIGTPLARVPRGTVLTGVPVPADVGDGQWLKIEEGANAGLFAWMGDLSTAGRPALDTALAGDQTIVEAATMTAEPGAGAAEASGGDVSLAVGDVVDVAGTVGDTWVEVRRATGGVGYIPLVAIRSADAPIIGSEETATATDTPHRLRVVNRCARGIRVGLYFRDADGWQANGGAFWSVDAGDTSILRRQGQVISAISPDIYGASFDAMGKPIDQEGDTIDVAYGRFRIRMAKLSVVTAADGDYEIVYQC